MVIPLREVCDFCSRDIKLGQSIEECNKCNIVIHSKCFKSSNFSLVNYAYYCNNCTLSVEKRYNPYCKLIELYKDDLEESEDLDFSTISKVASVLENCRSFTLNNFNDIDPDLFRDNISTFFLNIDGNSSNFDNFLVEQRSLKHTFSVIGLAETNTNSDSSATYQIPDYYSFYQDTLPGKTSGTGVALYIRNSYNATLNTKLSRVSENLETLFVTINHDDGPVTIGVVYRPPSGNKDDAMFELETIPESCPNKHVYILGDYNVDLHEENNKLVNDFEEVTVSTGFYPVISLYTHQKAEQYKKSCIDNIFTNDTESVLFSGTISHKLSQHLPIFQILSISSVKESKAQFIQYYDYCNSNLDKFVEDLAGELHQVNPEDFSSFYTKFNDVLDNVCKLETPKTTKRTVQNNPWITPGLIAAVGTKHRLHDEWKNTRTLKNPSGNDKLHTKFTDYRRTLKHVIKNAKSKYYQRKILEKSGDKKKTWEIINELRGKTRRQIKPQFKIDNVKVINRRVIANEFNKYFVSIATKMNSDCIGLLEIADLPTFTEYLPRSCASSIYMYDCSSEEISLVITELQNGKSSDIPIRLLKHSSKVICPVLEKLYNKCITDGVFPDELKIGRVSPIYKKSDEELMENYRPVSTLPVFGKIFEKLIYNRLYSFFTSQNVINQNQFGFRKSHSTSHALNYSVTHIEKCLKDKQHVIGIFIDLSKAFDTIDHRILLSKLNNYGIRGNAYDLINSYLTNRMQYVHVLDENSEKLPISYGVPQGSVLGPLLFLIYINDLSNTTQLCQFVLFADDTNIFVSGNTKRLAYEKANSVLQLVSRYMICNKLHINLSKCCYMYFSPHKYSTENTLDDDDIIILNGKEITRVREAKFLGVTIDDKLTWGPHIKSLVNKLRSCTARICRIRHCLPQSLHKDIYHTLFESHLSYAIPVWGNVSMNSLEPLFITQKKCIRILFGDSEAFTNKFKTCARTRPFGQQTLGAHFYMKESSKPLFSANDILTVHNIYRYQSTIETYKILKLRTPMSLYELYNISTRKETLLLSQNSSCKFIDASTKLWNTFNEKLSINDLMTSIGSVKVNVKKLILKTQKDHDQKEWCYLNYS